MAHVYLDNSYNNEQIRKMQSAESDSIIIDNFISQEELKTLRELINSVEYPETGGTSKYAGSSYEWPPYGPVMEEIFHNKLVDAIGPHQLDFFAWQEAIRPWKIHADLRWYADKIPHKVILIPLDVIGNNKDKWDDTYSLTFKQRNYLRNCKNTGIGKKGNTDQSEWKRAYDDPNTENTVNGYSISHEIHEKYLSHMPYDHLEGLEIDKIYHWKPGSAVIWDQTMLHCADNFLARNIKTKLSILIMTNQA